MPPIFTEVPPESTSITVVRLVGEFDLADAQELERAFDDALHSGRRRLVADLSEATFIGSTVINALAVVRQRGEDADIEVVLIRPGTRGMRRLFEITRLDTVLQSFNSLEEALSSH
jgi:anti-sigma B factor antagonist